MFRAKDTFWAPGNRRIVKGDLVAPHDPVVKGREELFEAVVIPQASSPAQVAAAQVETPEETESPEGTGNGEKSVMPAPPEGPAGASTPERQQQAPAPAKKTAAKTTAPARRSAGGAK